MTDHDLHLNKRDRESAKALGRWLEIKKLCPDEVLVSSAERTRETWELISKQGCPHGTPEIAPAQSPVTRAYARFWQKLPFVTTGVPGFGIFAVSGAGRARWEAWPEIISDDTFARLNFAPEERVRLPQTYRWPMIEGLSGLIRVRRRQDRGVREIGEKFPRLLKNADPSTASRTGKLNAILRDPLGFLVYGFIALCVRPPGGKGDWARGR